MEIKIKNSTQLTFTNIQFKNTSVFYFRGIKSLNFAKESGSPRIIFQNTQFLPFQASFDNISIEKGQYSILPIFIFRYCNLKDVYFSNNQMQLFSFYKSAFDEARFISSDWGKYNKRNNVLSEEILFEKLKKLEDTEKNRKENLKKSEITQNNKKNIEKIKVKKDSSDETNNEKEKNFREKYFVEDLNDYLEIASLYRRMKTALDKTKDYPEASKFYYNEFEMRRNYFKQHWQKHPLRLLLYSLYKWFVGYGERAGRSFLWFLFFIFSFAALYFFTGYYDFHGQYLNYDIALKYLSWQNFTNAIPDFGKSLLHAMVIILPRNFLFFRQSSIQISDLQILLLS